VALFLGLSDIVVAVIVFVLFARHDQSLALAAWLAGTPIVTVVDHHAVARLEGLAVHVRRAALMFLFAWSFVTGAGIAFARI
jgi:hypothetical protein